jgi:hypothetical protein
LIFFDIAGENSELKREIDMLSYELEQQREALGELNLSLLACSALAQSLMEESEDYYDKWQAESRVSYSLWQIIDSATNITWEGQDVTQVNIIIPRWQWEYILNLSKTYGLNYPPK